MRTLLAILTTLIVVISPAALAASTLITPATDFTSMADEAAPSTSGGDYVAKTRYGPVSYPADATNVPAALAGGSPVIVLNHKGSINGLHDAALDIVLVHNLLEGRHFYSADSYQSYVLYGMWSDLNGDKFIQNAGWDNDPGMDAANDAIFGNNLAGRERATAANDEWDGITTAEYQAGGHSEYQLVVYNTGYGYRWQGAYTIGLPGGGPLLPGQGVVSAGSNNEGYAPLWTMDPISENDGYHKSKVFGSGTTVFIEGNYDNNLLVTNVWETYLGKLTLRSLGGCDLKPEGCRQYTPVETALDANGNKIQPYDVDIYKSLDPAIQALMVNTVLPTYRNTLVNFNTTDSALDDAYLNTQNATVAAIDSAGNATGDAIDNITALIPEDLFSEIEPVLDAVNDTVTGIDRTLNDTSAERNRRQGAIDDIIYPSVYEGPLAPDGFGSNPWDYTQGWHPYMDATMNFGCASAPLPAFIITGHCGQGVPTGLGAATLRPGTDTHGSAPGPLYVFAHFGLWWDEDKDGFITDHSGGTNEEAANGCPDLRDCGNNDNPNEIPGGNIGHIEFKPVCGIFEIRVTPQTAGKVWPRGAYLTGDGDAPGNDHTTPMVQDITSDGRVDRLITSGDVDIRMTCDSADLAEHFPDWVIWLPAGNADFDVVATTEFTQKSGDTGMCVTHNNGVIEATGQKECTFDTDRSYKWAV